MNKIQNIRPRVGIDIGKVIMSPITGGKADTSFLNGNMDRAMQSPPSPGAMEGVKALVETTEGQAWLISKAGPTVQHKPNNGLGPGTFMAKPAWIETIYGFA